MTDPLRSSDPLALRTTPPAPQIDQFGNRPVGMGIGSGELLRQSAGLGERQAPYEVPLWARTLTMPATTAASFGTDQARSSSSREFPFRMQAPNIFGEAQAPQDAVTQAMQGPLGVALGMTPGERELEWHGIATTPMTMANFATWGREGLMAALSSIFLDGAYQQQGAAFGEDTTYRGPAELDPMQQFVKGTIEANKTVGDVVWAVFDGVSQWRREAENNYRAQQVRRVFTDGNASRPLNPMEVGFLDNVLTSLGIASSSAKYSRAELHRAALEHGYDDVTMAATFYDLPVEVVAAIKRNPAITDEQLAEMVKGLPISQDPLTNLVTEAGFQVLLLAGGGVGAARGLGMLARMGGPAGTSFAAAMRGGRFAGGQLGGRLATGTARELIGSSAGFATRKVLQLNALNTAAGWTTRGLEWGIKQYGLLAGDDALVRMADRWLWEMPWSMNPGLNLIDGFTQHPIKRAKEILEPGNRRIRIGDEGGFSDVGAINLSRTGAKLGGFLEGPYRVAGRFDIDAATATRAALDDVDVTIAGAREALPKTHPVAVLVDRIRAMTIDDIYDRLLADLGWERTWVIEAFDSGKYGLDLNDLKNFLIYAYAQVVRDRGSAPMNLVGATMRERSRSFFRIEAPEIIDAFFADLSGKGGNLAYAVRRQWWELADLNDSHMAALKSRKGAEYDPYVAFESMRHWVAASKRLHEAYIQNAAAGNLVVTFARRLNPDYIGDTIDHVMLHYQYGQPISTTDVLNFRRAAGPVEASPKWGKALRNTRKRWKREEYVRMLEDLLGEANEGAPPRVRIDPDVPDDWQPGVNIAAEARVLGIEQSDVIAIQIARDLAEPPASMPPQNAMRMLAKETGVAVDTLAVDPRSAWERIFAWYDEKVSRIADAVRVTKTLRALAQRIDADGAASRIDPALASRVSQALAEINAEVVNQPLRRPTGYTGAPPAGVTWADATGIERWRLARERAADLADTAASWLEDPLGRLRVVGEVAAEGAPTGGQFVARAADAGMLRDIMDLLRYYESGRGAFTVDDTSRAILDDLTRHPFLKINALAEVMWPPTMPPELAALAVSLRKVDMDQLARETVAEVMDITPETDVTSALAGLTTKYAGHMVKGEQLLEETLKTRRAFDTIYGVIKPETRMLVDRRAAAGVEPGRRIISRDATRTTQRRAQRSVRIREAERAITEADAREAAIARELAEIDQQAPQEVRPAPAAAAEAMPPEAPAPAPAAEAAAPAPAPAPEAPVRTLSDVQNVGKNKYGFWDSKGVWNGFVDEASAIRGHELAAERGGYLTMQESMALLKGEPLPERKLTGTGGAIDQAYAAANEAELSPAAQQLREIAEMGTDEGDAAYEALVDQYGTQSVTDAEAELAAWQAQVAEGQRLNLEAEARGQAANTSEEFARLREEMRAAQEEPEAPSPEAPPARQQLPYDESLPWHRDIGADRDMGYHIVKDEYLAEASGRVLHPDFEQVLNPRGPDAPPDWQQHQLVEATWRGVRRNQGKPAPGYVPSTKVMLADIEEWATSQAKGIDQSPALEEALVAADAPARWQDAASYVEQILDISISEKGSPAHRGSITKWASEIWDQGEAQLKGLDSQRRTKTGALRKRMPAGLDEQAATIRARQNVSNGLMMVAQEEGAALQLLGRLGKEDFVRLVDWLVEQGEGRGREASTGTPYGTSLFERLMQGGRESAAAGAPEAPRLVSGEVIEGTGAGEIAAAEREWLAGAEAFDRTQQRARDETFMSELNAGDPRAQLSEDARVLLDAEWNGEGTADWDRIISELEGRVGADRVAEADRELAAWKEANPGWTAAGPPELPPLLGAGPEARTIFPMAHPTPRNIEGTLQRLAQAQALADDAERAGIERVIYGMDWVYRTGRGVADVDAALSRMDPPQLLEVARRMRTELEATEMGTTPDAVNRWLRSNADLFDGFDEKAKAAAEVVPQRPRITGAQTSFPDPIDVTRDVPATFELVELDDLVTSDRTDVFPSELQPRDRSRVASKAQIDRLSREWRTELSLRVESGGEGPPLIVGDNWVLAGNGRTMAMRLMSDEKWASQKHVYAVNAERFGLTPEQVLAMDRPVIVRRLPDEFATREYADAFNAATGGKSAAEAAVALEARVGPELVAKLDFGDKVNMEEVLTADKNRALITEVVDSLPEGERAQFWTAGGDLSQQGVTLLRGAMLARVLPDRGLVTRLLEQTGDISRYTRGLEEALPQVLQAEARAELAGQPMTIGPYLAGALRRIFEVSDQNVPAADWPSYFTTEGFGLIEGAAEANAVALPLAKMNNQQQVAAFLRGYARALDDSTTAAGGLLIAEDRSWQGFLNRGIEAVNLYRNEAAKAKAAKKAGTAKELQGEGLFGSDDIAFIPGDDGVVRTVHETPESTVMAASEVPTIESSAAAVSARLNDVSRVVVHDLDELDAVAPDTPVVFRSMQAREAQALRMAGDDPDRLPELVDGLLAEYHSFAPDVATGAARQAQRDWYYAVRKRFNEGTSTTPLADLIILKALSRYDFKLQRRVERWSADGQYNAQIGQANILPDTDARDLAQRYLAMLRRVEDVAGPTDVVQVNYGDAAIAGSRSRTVARDFTEATGIEPDPQPAIDSMEQLTQSGATVYVRPDDEVMQFAGQSVSKLPRVPSDKLTILNDTEFLDRRTRLTNELERVRAQREAAKTQLAEQQQRGGGGVGRPPQEPELDLPDEAWELYQRYVYDPAAAGIGVARPRLIGEVEDVLKSLDRDVPEAPGSTITATEKERLAVLLRQFLTDKYDEWKLPDQPQSMPRRIGTKLGTEAAGTTPTEHAVLLDELANELAHKVFVTDEPLEGYSGVGYEFIPAPTKGLSGEYLSTRLFYETTLTDELLAADRLVPGMGAELASGRMATFDKRVDDAHATAAARNLAETSWLRTVRAGFDTVFGPRRQQEVHAQAIARFADDLMELTPDEWRAARRDPALMESLEAQRRIVMQLVRHWHEHMAKETAPVTQMRMYRHAGLVDPRRIEDWTTEFLAQKGAYGDALRQRLDARRAAGAKTPVWDAWRKADNRVRAYFAEREGPLANFVDWAYETRAIRKGSEVMSGLTTQYHVFRFLMDMRWLAMEFLEAPTLIVAREGPGALMDAIKIARGQRPKGLLFNSADSIESNMSRWAWWASQEMTSGGYMRLRESAVFALVQRAQARTFVADLERLAARDPRLSAMMRDFRDTPAQYLTRLDRDWRLLTTRQRVKIPEGEMRELLAPYLREGTITAEELETFVANGTWTSHPGLQQAIAHADDPVARLLLRRFEVITSQAIDDAAQLVFGQVDRSNIQRLLNHPLLYWPISYQIKATKWLAGLLLDRVGGFDTGAGGMVTLGMIWETHRDALVNDPHYQQLMKDNENLIFFASMLLPITPWDIGISLSPWTRMALAAVTEGDPSAGYYRNIFGVGPFYSYFQLLPRLIREQAEGPPGAVGDIAAGLQRFFPLSTYVPPVSRERHVQPAWLPEQRADRFAP